MLSSTYLPIVDLISRSSRAPIDAVPAIEHMPQRLSLGLLNDRAPLPCFGLDFAPDGFSDERGEIVRVQCVQFPAAITVVANEPRISRVSLLVRCREPRQAVMRLRQGDALHLDMIAIILSEPLG